jgi:hypothetical protein
VKRPLERRCGGGWRVRRLRDRVSAIRTHTRGAGRKGRGRGGELACTGRRWSASLIHLQRARPCRPVSFFIVHGDSRSASRRPCMHAVVLAGGAKLSSRASQLARPGTQSGGRVWLRRLRRVLRWVPDRSPASPSIVRNDRARTHFIRR